jgi:hypothetical protein
MASTEDVKMDGEEQFQETKRKNLKRKMDVEVRLLKTFMLTIVQ